MYESRQKTIDLIRNRAIQKMMLAGATELDPARISDYIKHRPLAEDRCKRIEKTVEDILQVWDASAPFRVILDSPELLAKALENIKNNRERDAAEWVKSFRTVLEDVSNTRAYIEAKQFLAEVEEQIQNALSKFAGAA